MNNKILFPLVAVFLVATSCQKALETKSLTTSSETLPQCKNVSCPSIDVEYLTVSGTSDAAALINAEIQEFISQSLYIGEEERESTVPTVEQAMKDFIQLYRIHSAEFPNISAEYFAEITVLETFNTKKLLSLRCRNYIYTGGAHGYGAVTFKNFNPSTGATLSYEDIFKDVAAFEALAEKLFKKQNGIPDGETSNASGFWFEDGIFYLPETFGISKESVTILYNQYEIASYAAGSIEVEIPIEEVNEMLKISID